MGKTEQAGQAEGAGRVRVGVAVKTLPTPTLSIEIDIPPRSRLYGLVPREAGTVRGESLTSYINRLGWAHGVSPRDLVRQEMLPGLLSSLEGSSKQKEWLRSSPYSVSVFSRRGGAMGLNGMGRFALEGATLLERLTMRPDLHLLTLRWWIGELPIARNMRALPAWCDVCYSEWRIQESPPYQPLLWMLQVVTMCPHHRRRLTERCPHCQRHQSVIATSKTRPGECTQCGCWLGMGTQSGLVAGHEPDVDEVDEETTDWQNWVIHSLETLRLTHLSSGIGTDTNIDTGMPNWATFFSGFASGMEDKGAFSRLASLTGIKRGVLYRWVGGTGGGGGGGTGNRTHHTYKPWLENILYVCYVCGVTPREVMENRLAPFKQTIQTQTAYHPPRPPRLPRSPRKQVNQEQCRELVQRVLDGREGPLGVVQIAKRLECSAETLLKHFPDECAVITQRMREYRAQRKARRMAQVCEEVRQAVITLHNQGIYPSQRRARTLLSRPGLMRQPQVSAAWRAARSELGLGPSQTGKKS